MVFILFRPYSNSTTINRATPHVEVFVLGRLGSRSWLVKGLEIVRNSLIK